MGKELTDLLVAVFSGLLVLVTIGLIVVGWKQASLTRRASREQLRAYVVVKEVVIEPVVHPTTGRLIEIIGRVVFVNSGQTPAYALEHFRSLTIAMRQDFQPPSRYLANTVILGPNIEHPDDVGLGAGIDDEQYSGLFSGTLTVFFWGEVRYRDIFNQEHWTRFGVRWPRIISTLDDHGTVPCSREWNNAN